MYLSLHKNKVTNFEGHYKNNGRITSTIERNKKQIESLIQRHSFSGIFTINNYWDYFSISGAIKVESLNRLGALTQSFLNQKEGRYFTKKGIGKTEYHTRGPRYVIALDPQYSVIQKLEILSEDIEDCIAYLKRYTYSNKNQFKDVSVILDYLKNALVTLFNSYIHQEKLGEFKFGNRKYDDNRNSFLELMKI